MPDWSFLVFFSLLFGLSEMYWGLQPTHLNHFFQQVPLAGRHEQKQFKLPWLMSSSILL
jgi:hypothetical protein